jgi:hypothetical protein
VPRNKCKCLPEPGKFRDYGSYCIKCGAVREWIPPRLLPAHATPDSGLCRRIRSAELDDDEETGPLLNRDRARASGGWVDV